MNLGFAGTPGFAVRILQALIESSHAVRVVFTQPDARRGRGRKLVPSPVRSLAESHGVPVRTPERIGDDLSRMEALDALVVAAYGQILPRAVLDAPARGCINVHASLLPRWRGAAPVERAIMAGDTLTGVSIMQMDVGLDTGPVLMSRSIVIAATDTGASLTVALADLGAQALLETLKTPEAFAGHSAGQCPSDLCAENNPRGCRHRLEQPRRIHQATGAGPGASPHRVRIDGR